MGDSFQNALPKLGDKRLALAGKQSHRIRKMTSIMNDKLKTDTIRYNKALDKDSKSFAYKMWQKSIPLKDQMLQMRSTKRCLQKRRQSVLLENSSHRKYGLYDGLSLHDLRHEIDQVIRDSHPRARRVRKAERLLNNGKRDGRLLDYGVAKESLEIIIKRPLFPPKGEHDTGFNIRKDNSHATSGVKVGAQLRLPAIKMSRANAMEKKFDRPTFEVGRMKYGMGKQLEMEHIWNL